VKDALLDNAKTSIEKALEFEGMTTRQGLALMSLFLDRVSHVLPQALCFEFATYRGRTAAIMAQIQKVRSQKVILSDLTQLENSCLLFG